MLAAPVSPKYNQKVPKPNSQSSESNLKSLLPVKIYASNPNKNSLGLNSLLWDAIFVLFWALESLSKPPLNPSELFWAKKLNLRSFSVLYEDVIRFLPVILVDTYFLFGNSSRSPIAITSLMCSLYRLKQQILFIFQQIKSSFNWTWNKTIIKSQRMAASRSKTSFIRTFIWNTQRSSSKRIMVRIYKKIKYFLFY